MAVLLKGTGMTFHIDFFLGDPEIVSVQLSGHSSHQDRHQGLGWDHMSGQAQSCHTFTDAAAAVSPSGSGIKLSLHFWGTSLLSWFYWGKIPPLITPH